MRCDIVYDFGYKYVVRIIISFKYQPKTRLLRDVPRERNFFFLIILCTLQFATNNDYGTYRQSTKFT